MGSEIERKFLVKDLSMLNGLHGQQCLQGYIDTTGAEVRIRIIAESAFLTLKSAKKEMVRSEYEYNIPVTDAQEILRTMCQKAVIKKCRYKLKQHNLLWEIDVFQEDNQGLVIAELETELVADDIELPDWVSEEITGNADYYNENLAITPYKHWNTK